MTNQSPEQLFDWLHLIRAEYSEMPGLHLSKRQARRLWGLDPDSCDLLLTALETSHFLRQTGAGEFVRGDLDY